MTKMQPMTPEECMTIYGRAWFARDRDQRLELIRQCCTEDIVFVDHAGRFEGADAVTDHLGSFLEMWPAPEPGQEKSKGEERGRSAGKVRVEVVTPIDVRDRYFRYSFVWDIDGNRSGGTDFGEFAEDGRMRLITVWNGNADFPVPTTT